MVLRLAIFPLFLPLGPACAAGLWEERGDWSIMLSEEGSCYAKRVLDDGTEVQFGTEPARRGGYFALYNAAWTNIQDGDAGTVEFNFGDERFGGDSEGRIVDGVPGGYAFFNNPAFIDAFAGKQTVTVIGTSGAEFEFDLTGTNNAVNGVFECQEQNPIEASDAE